MVVAVFFVVLLVVAEDIASEVVGAIPPDGVDVVGVILDVGGFDEKVASLDSVVISFAEFERARPAKG